MCSTCDEKTIKKKGKTTTKSKEGLTQSWRRLSRVSDVSV